MSLTDADQKHSNDSSAAALVRRVGAFERLFCRYTERNPAHFCIVAEFDVALGEEQLTAALEMVRQRHPLLTVHVEDHPDSRLGFYRSDQPAPIPLRVRHDTTWQPMVAEELSRPFDRSTAPLMRAGLITSAPYYAVVLTFNHIIADGISSVMVLNDLLSALNGQVLPKLPVPPSMEEVLARTLTAVDHPVPLATAAPDSRTGRSHSLRPFDGTAPHVHSVVIDSAATAQLVSRCRREQTTVHSAIATAVSRIYSEQYGDDYVRAFTPINIRRLINVDGDCADYLSSTTTGVSPLDGAPFWEQARAITAHLEVARSAAGVLAAASAIEHAIGIDVDATTVEGLFTSALSFEFMATNLGVQDFQGTGPIHPTALWGPVQENQITDNFVIGSATYQGVLRIVTCAYEPAATFLDAVADLLRQASQ